MTEPTEARQDELAGIKKRALLTDEERQSIGKGYEFFIAYKEELDYFLKAQQDKDFSLTVSSGGGKCPDCGGSGHPNYPPGRGWMAHCLKCNGTGQKPIVTKTVGEIIKEWEDGQANTSQ